MSCDLQLLDCDEKYLLFINVNIYTYFVQDLKVLKIKVKPK